jgi:DNA-binding NarL/FixJ family response regulator
MADPREVVRAAGHRLFSQFRFGSLDLSEADVACELLSAVNDPLVESSFRTIYAGALAAACRYREGLDTATALLESAARYRLDFAVPYGKGVSAICNAGMRQWTQAETLLLEGASAAHGSDSNAEQYCYSALLRVLAQQGRHHAALGLDIPPFTAALPSAHAELVCSRALVLASAGRVDEALQNVDETRGMTTSVDAMVLAAAVDAAASLKLHQEDAIDRVAALEQTAFSRGNLDLLVTAYRAIPELLAVLLRSSDRMISLVRRVRDEDLARAVGHGISADDDPRVRLTPREREVFELVRQGLSNREIARLLFIEESTARVHTHHIYDKLGTRSRVALRVQAALERAHQATSATGNTDSADE